MTTLFITTLSIMDLIVTLSMTHYVEGSYDEHHIYNYDVEYNVIMLSVIILNVVALIVMAPSEYN
jgi:hypothetical protein